MKNDIICDTCKKAKKCKLAQAYYTTGELEYLRCNGQYEATEHRKATRKKQVEPVVYTVMRRRNDGLAEIVNAW